MVGERGAIRRCPHRRLQTGDSRGCGGRVHIANNDVSEAAVFSNAHFEEICKGMHWQGPPLPVMLTVLWIPEIALFRWFIASVLIQERWQSVVRGY